MSSCSQILLTVRVFIIVCVLYSANSCFIRNCPRGGKRGMDTESQVTHKCMSCGPNNSGQCFGPSICCGSFGCQINTELTKKCASEDSNTSPCAVIGEPCGTDNQGQCAADGICCNSEACSLNKKCEHHKRKDLSSKEKLLQLLQRILEDDKHLD